MLTLGLDFYISRLLWLASTVVYILPIYLLVKLVIWLFTSNRNQKVRQLSPTDGEVE